MRYYDNQVYVDLKQQLCGAGLVSFDIFMNFAFWNEEWLWWTSHSIESGHISMQWDYYQKRRFGDFSMIALPSTMAEGEGVHFR